MKKKVGGGNGNPTNIKALDKDKEVEAGFNRTA
jgi:hypothetical protein